MVADQETRLRRLWTFAMVVVFVPGTAWTVFTMITEPLVIGSHAASYSDAAAALIAGRDPWTVGPPLGVFAGPPTMLLPYVPFTYVPELMQRILWVAADVALAIWVLRRLRAPVYWLIFPPMFQSIVLGHPEILVLAAVVISNPLGGLGILVKPYTALPLLAERRWSALALGAMAGVGTLLLLPWGLFLADAPVIAENLARQAHSDSVFGQPVLVAIAVVGLLSLGVRRALWLAVPVLWPYAQLNYKTMTLPMLSPILAIAWATPLPGATLVGIVIEAALRFAGRRRPLPAWIRAGMEIRAPRLDPSRRTSPAPSPAPA